MLKQATLSLCIAASVLSAGCATQSTTKEITVSETLYTVRANSQVQFVASDLAARLGVAGVEWNARLKPWDYRTLRTREINLTKSSTQAVYLELFQDTGLLPYYDPIENRITVEPFAVNTKKTTKFEPSFSNATVSAQILSEKKQQEDLKLKNLQRYNVYKGESLRQTVNSWSQQSNYKTVIWYITDVERQAVVNAEMTQNLQIVERSPTAAIDSLIKDINQKHPETPLNLRIDRGTKSLIVHGLASNEPLKVIKVDQKNTKAMLEEAAKFYGLDVVYKARNFRVKPEYLTVLTSNAELSLETMMSQYNIEVILEESAKQVVAKQKEVNPKS